jgi:hypothetical protein
MFFKNVDVIANHCNNLIYPVPAGPGTRPRAAEPIALSAGLNVQFAP